MIALVFSDSRNFPIVISLAYRSFIPSVHRPFSSLPKPNSFTACFPFIQQTDCLKSRFAFPDILRRA